MLALALCVCATAAVSLADRLPRQVDRYLLTRPGEAGLYRVTYADGGTGWLTVNVVNASADSLSYAALLGGRGRAVEVNYRFTNWQGSGQAYTRVDTLARDDNHLTLLAQYALGQTEFFEPPLPVWNQALPATSAAAPFENATTYYGQTWTVRTWLDGEEPWTLPGGQTATARRFVQEWRLDGPVYDTTTAWIVPGPGQVAYEQRDNEGGLTLRVELVTNTRLSDAAAPSLPWSDLLAGTPGDTALYRGGPLRTGANPDASLAGPDLKVIYRRQSGLGVTASPAYADGLFYLADQAGQLVALDAYTAAPRWQFTAGGPIAAAPAVAGGVVYFGAGDKHLYALEARDGHFLWRRRLLDTVSTSPAVVEGTVYLGGEDRRFYALDARTGAERWRFVASDRVISSPAVADGRVIFGADDGVIYALDAGSGDLLWRHPLDAAVEATPAVREGLVFVGSTGRQFVALEASTGREVWQVATRFGYQASPAVGQGRVYVAGVAGTVAAYDAQTGAPLWTWTDRAEAGFVSSPLLVGGHLLATSSAGHLFVLEAASGALLHTVDVGDTVTGSPVWTGEAVLLANGDGDLLALQGGPEARSLRLEPLWQHEYSAPGEGLQQFSFYADPLVAGGRVLALLRGGRLWSIDPATGAGLELAHLGDEVWGTPAERGGTIFATTLNGGVTAIDSGSGAATWTTDLGRTYRFGPAVDEARVYVHSLSAPETIVSALDAGSGEVVWEHGLPDGNSTPVLAGGHVVVSGAALTALDPQTGAVRWESEPLVALGTLAAFDGVVYAGDSDGQGASFLAVEAATGATLWRRTEAATFRYGRPAHDSATGTVFAPSQEGTLYAFAADTGEVRWRFQADSGLQSTPIVKDGVVYLTSMNGQLFAVDTQTGRLLNHFRPGTNIATVAGPALGEGVLLTVHGGTLHALRLNAEGPGR